MVMAEHEESIVTEKIEEKLRGSSTSSDSGEEKTEPSTAVKSKVFRLFGREKPLHLVLGGGQAANMMLWRDKKMSAGVFVGATVTWVLLELVGYHLLTLVCNGLLISLVMLFLWSKATTVINKSPPHVPEVSIPENQAVKIALEVRCEINRAFSLIRETALGRDLKKFLAVIVGLYFLSIVGNSVSFLSMLYILFITLHTVPALYEKYENKIDSFAEKAMVELKKQYATFDAKVLRKIPRGPLKHKQH